MQVRETTVPGESDSWTWRRVVVLPSYEGASASEVQARFMFVADEFARGRTKDVSIIRPFLILERTIVSKYHFLDIQPIWRVSRQEFDCVGKIANSYVDTIPGIDIRQVGCRAPRRMRHLDYVPG